MTQKTHWTQVKVARAPAQELADALRKANKEAQPDTPPEYEGKDRLAELSWFKKGENSRRWPARFTDKSGNVIASAEAIDWNDWNDFEGLSAEIEFAAKVNELLVNALSPKKP